MTAHDRNLVAASAWGAGVGALGGLIGLGGAEFRLPLLIGVFGFAALEAIILNKAISLVVVASSLLFRSAAVPLAAVADSWPVIATLLSGSLIGAWFGADLATRLERRSLHRVIAVLLGAIAIALVTSHWQHAPAEIEQPETWRMLVGVGAGFLIGVVAAFLGVAGGELLIPTLILLFGIDIKLAGSLSLAISLPTMVVGFARYSRDASFAVLARHPKFLLAMCVGSIVGAAAGGLLLGVVPAPILMPILAVILATSAVKIWRH